MRHKPVKCAVFVPRDPVTCLLQNHHKYGFYLYVLINQKIIILELNS